MRAILSGHRYIRVGLGVAAAVLVLDFATKWWILNVVMQPPLIIEVTPFFNLVLGWNRGVSFGLFNSDSGFSAWFLSALALVIMAVLAVWLGRCERTFTALAIGMIIGGAAGNVIDRMTYGAVADFLDFHVAGYHWPAFNVADSGITVGAAMLILESLFGAVEKHKNKEGKGNGRGGKR